MARLGPIVIAVTLACSGGGAADGGAGASAGGAGDLPSGTAGSSSTGAGGNGGFSGGGWRSALYPSDWAPGFASKDGHRIADFSYAGYHNGEKAIGSPAVAAVFEVTSFGADKTGASDATKSAQDAIAAAQKNGGGVVHFAAGLYRIDGVLNVTAAKIVLRGDGADKSRLHFSKSAGLSFASHLTFRGNLVDSAEQLLAVDGAPFSSAVTVKDASAFKPGDDVVVGWVITDAFIAEHQMSGTWDHAGNAFAHKWQPFFRRQVVAVDGKSTPNTITVDVPLRYPAKLRDQASIKKQTGYLDEVGVEDLGFANAVGWDAAWSVDQVHVLELHGVKDAWVRRIASFTSPSAPPSGDGQGAHLQSGGLIVDVAKRVTIADSDLRLAENRGGGGNGYLFEVRQSSEVLFRDLVAADGRHNFIQNWGFGASGIVWLRVKSSGGLGFLSKGGVSFTGNSEFHHSLALACLIDQSTFDDGWKIANRGSESTYAGHTGTLDVMWSSSGKGRLISRQFGYGYVVGTREIQVVTTLQGIVLDGDGTAPEDYTEGLDKGATLEPQSLYEDQLARRLKK